MGSEELGFESGRCDCPVQRQALPAHQSPRSSSQRLALSSRDAAGRGQPESQFAGGFLARIISASGILAGAVVGDLSGFISGIVCHCRE